MWDPYIGNVILNLSRVGGGTLNPVPFCINNTTQVFVFGPWPTVIFQFWPSKGKCLVTLELNRAVKCIFSQPQLGYRS